MQPASFPETSILSADIEVARRIAFVMARMIDSLGLPANSKPDDILQVAMEQPEKVKDGEYGLIYRFRSPEVPQ